MLLKEIKVQNLIEDYRVQLGIDVSRHFQGLNKFALYQCLDTEYRFFYPYNIGGDSKFYENLEKYEWYYMPWKWEHQKIKGQLKGKEKILEVGSGGLGFLSKMKESGFNVTGLELNKNSLKKAKFLNLELHMETVQNFSVRNQEVFDVVCSFQVLEHISQVNSFIKSQLDCLKPSGTLVISVPNNKSFIRKTEGGILNKPPHHMGLWDERSLRNLESIFNLKVEKVFFEPLQKYHYDWYVNSVLIPFINRNKLLLKIYNKFGSRKILIRIISVISKYIKGHSILIIYKKND
ncbi:methyltransferase family protein [Gramella sp. Hel_I_59]|nr:methyltransferase family protein [Gramella sp. Hel_I_59]